MASDGQASRAAELREREGLLRQIDETVRRGDAASAAVLAERALALGPEHPGLLNLVAHGFLHEGDVPRAIAKLERARALAPSDVHVLNGLGIAYKRAGRFGEALAVLDEALAIDPRFAIAHFNRGTVLEAQGELEGARTAYELAVVGRPTAPMPWRGFPFSRPCAAITNRRWAMPSAPQAPMTTPRGLR